MVMMVFGVIGYVLKKLDYPLAPLVLALVLGDRTSRPSGSRSSCRRGISRSSGRTRWWHDQGSAADAPPVAALLLGRRAGGAADAPKVKVS
jgi:TctA family transporter